MKYIHEGDYVVQAEMVLIARGFNLSPYLSLDGASPQQKQRRRMT